MITRLQIFGVLTISVLIIFAVGYWRYSVVKHDLELERAKTAQLEQNVATLTGVNEANAATIARLEENRKLDLAAIDRLSAAVTDVAVKADRTRTIIREIERNDPAVVDFFAIPLPDSVRDTLNTPDGS